MRPMLLNKTELTYMAEALFEYRHGRFWRLNELKDHEAVKRLERRVRDKLKRLNRKSGSRIKGRA